MNTLENFHKTLLEAFVISVCAWASSKNKLTVEFYKASPWRLVPERSPSASGSLSWVIWSPGTDMEGRILFYLYRAMTRMIAIVIDSEHSLSFFISNTQQHGSQLNSHGPSLLGFEIGNSGLGALLRSIITPAPTSVFPTIETESVGMTVSRTHMRIFS